jgi:hypothetical protein
MKSTQYLFKCRAAYRLAGSFNLRGRLRQLFHVLTDDKIGSGPRPAPNSLQHTSKPAPVVAPADDSQAAKVTASAADPADSDTSVKSVPSGKQVKRKADDTPGTASRGKNRR